MTTNIDTSPEPQVVKPVGDDALRRFTLLALASLDFEVTHESDDVFVIQATEDQSEMFNGARSIRFSFSEQRAATPSQIEVVARGSRMFGWLCEQLTQTNGVIQALPSDSVTNVHNVTTALFEAYDVENGNVQLAGCQLQDRPILQFFFAENDEDSTPPMRVVNVDEEGNRIDGELAAKLGLMDVVHAGSKSKKVSNDRVTAWRRQGDSLGKSDENIGLTAIVVVWCKYAGGKIAFTIDSKRVEQRFDGWAQLFANKTVLPPPYKCPASGIESRHLAITDDGVLTCKEAIDVCAVSEERVIATALETCAVSGEQATTEHIVVCPISNERVLSTVAKPCDMCRQVVSPSVLTRGRCQVCWQLKPIDKDDPIMARVLGEWPKLDSWRNWSVSESKEAYVLVASGFMKRLLVVATKEPLDVQRLATGTRFSKNWTDVDSGSRESWLT